MLLRNKLSISETARHIYEVHGRGVIIKLTFVKWFTKLKNGKFNVDNSKFDKERLKLYIKDNHCKISSELR